MDIFIETIKQGIKLKLNKQDPIVNSIVHTHRLSFQNICTLLLSLLFTIIIIIIYKENISNHCSMMLVLVPTHMFVFPRNFQMLEHISTQVQPTEGANI